MDGDRGWRDELRELAQGLAGRARHMLDRWERRIDRDPYCIVGYRGYGTPGRALVLGRVLQDDGHLPPDPAHSALTNLIAAIKRLESDPLSFARVQTRLGDATHRIEADDEGFLRAWVPAARPVDPGWHRTELALVDSAIAATRGTAEWLVPAPGARFGVISDLDDTVLQSEVTQLVRAARLVLLENARTRLPFPGVAALYRALHAGLDGRPANPIFYVSKSPWNMYEVVAEFLSLQDLPAGPLLLRDLDLGLGAPGKVEHKASTIAEILATYPALPFVLIGDSGQKDPEIYRALLHDHPGRIPAIYIRSVDRRPDRVAAIGRLADEVREAGGSLVLAEDTRAIARHAAEHGWIEPDRLPEIAGDARADAGTSGEKVPPAG